MKHRQRVKDLADTILRSQREAELETKLCIADKVEGELRKTITILEDVNRKQAEALDKANREIERLKGVVEAQDKIIKYRGERLAERGY